MSEQDRPINTASISELFGEVQPVEHCGIKSTFEANIEYWDEEAAKVEEKLANYGKRPWQKITIFLADTLKYSIVDPRPDMVEEIQRIRDHQAPLRLALNQCVECDYSSGLCPAMTFAIGQEKIAQAAREQATE